MTLFDNPVSMYLQQRYLLTKLFGSWENVPENIKEEMKKKLKENNHNKNIQKRSFRNSIQSEVPT